MPYLGSTLFVSVIVLLILSSLLGALLLATAFFGPFVERTARTCEERPKTSLLVGLPVSVVLFVVCAGLLRSGAGGRALGALLAGACVAFALMGLAGVSLRVGGALWSRADADRPYARIARGAIVLELAAALPIFGWFVILPLSLAMGVGAGLLSRLSRRAPAAAQQPWEPKHHVASH